MKLEDYFKNIIKDSTLSEKVEYLDNKKEFDECSEYNLKAYDEYYKKYAEYLSQQLTVKTKEEKIREDRIKKIKKIFNNE